MIPIYWKVSIIVTPLMFSATNLAMVENNGDTIILLAGFANLNFLWKISRINRHIIII